MAFRFKLGEPFDEGCRRIAVEQIERARAELLDKGDQAVAVHETRKSLKRLRALLRIVRPAMGEAAFTPRTRSSATSAQPVGRAGPACAARDGRQARRRPATGPRASLAACAKRIAAIDGEGAPLTLEAKPKALASDAKKRLAGAAYRRAAGSTLSAPGWSESYRKARRALCRSLRRADRRSVHEWRKGAQAHWRQMTLLARAWPDYLGARASEARRLSQLLGDDHDLAMLVVFVAFATPRRGSATSRRRSSRRPFVSAQPELREAARPRGERLFADGPQAAAAQHRAPIGDRPSRSKEHEEAGRGGRRAAWPSGVHRAERRRQLAGGRRGQAGGRATRLPGEA